MGGKTKMNEKDGDGNDYSGFIETKHLTGHPFDAVADILLSSIMSLMRDSFLEMDERKE